MRPELAIADGALGLWKAAGEVWPTTRDQRCWVHKTETLLAPHHRQLGGRVGPVKPMAGPPQYRTRDVR